MTSYYRFRSTDRLLGASRELESQTIFFAAPDSLNDPMEGFAEIVFKGDRILWENLFRHFILCLGWGVARVRLHSETQPITWDNIPWYNPAEASEAPLKAQLSQVAVELLATPDIQQLLDYLSGPDVEIGEDEVATILNLVHAPWIVAVAASIDPSSVANVDTTTAPVAGVAGKLAAYRKNAGIEDAEQTKVLKLMFQISRSAQQQLVLRSRLAEPPGERPNSRLIFEDFVGGYLQQLRKLMHPDWYTACFMEDISNASVWGHYADGHRGVCLKFRATPIDGTDTLPLYAPTAAGLDGPEWRKTPFPLMPVDYVSSSPRMNFFASLGNLPKDVLDRTWRFSPTGERSTIANPSGDDEDVWQKNYWQDFTKSNTTKLPDWAYEREHRLTFFSRLNSLSEPKMRLLRYDFADLEGIIFGMKTPDSVKVDIVRLIRKKCQQNGRTRFNFFQAVRSMDGKGIEKIALSLLKPESHSRAWVPASREHVAGKTL
jgi:hypothetical protein